MSAYEDLNHALKQRGYSITRSREIVFNTLSGSTPLTTADLIKRINKRIDRVSVYRTIKLFEELGIIQRLNFGFKYKLELSDRFAEHHHHLTCIGCNRITDINKKELEAFINSIASDKEFLPSAHQIEIQGYCKKCRETEKQLNN